MEFLVPCSGLAQGQPQPLWLCVCVCVCRGVNQQIEDPCLFLFPCRSAFQRNKISLKKKVVLWLRKLELRNLLEARR